MRGKCWFWICLVFFKIQKNSCTFTFFHNNVSVWKVPFLILLPNINLVDKETLSLKQHLNTILFQGKKCLVLAVYLNLSYYLVRKLVTLKICHFSEVYQTMIFGIRDDKSDSNVSNEFPDQGNKSGCLSHENSK